MPKINIRELLKFYDEKSIENKKHSSAMNGFLGEEIMICILKDYFQSQGKEIKILDEKVTEGCKGGKWLDKWVLNMNDRVLYQTEIKNWSAHSLGGIETLCDADEASVAKTSLHRWNKEWDRENQEFTNEKVNKVFKRMSKKNWEEKIEPLVCFWSCIHPGGQILPFFTVEAHNSNFSLVNVFSASLHLRSKRDAVIQVDSPLLLKRLQILDKLIVDD